MNFTLEKPKLARFTSSDKIIKDNHYYAGKEFIWNRRAMIGSKIYPQYYKNEDLKKIHVDELEAEELKNKQMIEEIRKKKILQLRAQDLARYAKSVRHRIIMERNCHQSPSHGDDSVEYINTTQELSDLVASRTKDFRRARSKDISWNFLEHASPKHIRQYLHESVLKGEEQMFKRIRENITKEEHEKQEKAQKQAEFRKNLRENLLDQHERTFELEQKLDTYSVRNIKNQSKVGFSDAGLSDLASNSDFYKGGSSSLSIDISLSPLSKDLKLKFPNRLPDIERKSSRLLASQIIKDKSPDEVDLHKVLELGKSDLRGSFINSMEKAVYESNNPLHKTLVDNSIVFKEVLEENFREKSPIYSKELSLTRLGGPSLQSNSSEILVSESERISPLLRRKLSSKAKAILEQDGALEEIKAFEQIYESAVLPIGQGRTVLDEADRICSDLKVSGVKEFRRRTKRDNC